MKVAVETTGVSNLMPSITIELSKYDLAELIIKEQVKLIQSYGGEPNSPVHQVTTVKIKQ